MESKRCNVVVLSMYAGIDVAEVIESVMYLIILTFQTTYFTLDTENINIWLVTSSEWSQKRQGLRRC